MPHCSEFSGDEPDQTVAKALFDARPHRNYNSQTKQFVTPEWSEQPQRIQSVFLDQARTILADIVGYVGKQAAQQIETHDELLHRNGLIAAQQQLREKAEERLVQLEAEVTRLRALVHAWQPTHRHVKRGFEYELLGEAEGQIATERSPTVCEGDRLSVYRQHDGKLWWRFPDEFHDGRFELID